MNELEHHLHQASSIVESWPEWKRRALGGEVSEQQQQYNNAITQETKIKALTTMLESINNCARREQELGGWLMDWSQEMRRYMMMIEKELGIWEGL